MSAEAGSIRARDPIKHVFIWPAVLVVLVIAIFPLVYSLTTSFLSYRLMPPTPPIPEPIRTPVRSCSSWVLGSTPASWMACVAAAMA